MPELPEVETIVRELQRKIARHTIRRFFVFDKKLPRRGFRLPVKILSVRRHGKYIIFHLTEDKNILIHLRMTGGLFFEKQRDKKLIHSRQKYERAAFLFSDGSILRFCDARRFGTVDWRRDGQMPELGINPLSPGFNSKYFYELLAGRYKRTSLALPDLRRRGPSAGRSRAIKSLLLNQRLISGIGNIYADESLWRAKIHPLRKSGALKPKEAGRLVSAIKKVLREAIEKGGFTLRDYKRTGGEPGHYQRSRKAYDREGQQCLRCGVRIKRIKVGGRSSYFCPACQH